MLTNFSVTVNTHLHQHLAAWIEESDRVPMLFNWQIMGPMDAHTQRSSHLLTARPFRIAFLPTSLFYLSPPHLSTLLSGNCIWAPKPTNLVQVSVPSNTSMSVSPTQKAIWVQTSIGKDHVIYTSVHYTSFSCFIDYAIKMFFSLSLRMPWKLRKCHLHPLFSAPSVASGSECFMNRLFN